MEATIRPERIEQIAQTWRQHADASRHENPDHARRIDRHARRVEADAERARAGNVYSNWCPTFFRGAVAAARTSRTGYFDAGYSLATHVRSAIEADVPRKVPAELDRMIERAGVVGLDDFSVDEAWDDADLSAFMNSIWDWLLRTVPRCMRLVPAERKRTFMAGVLRAVQHAA